jgi:hypothetical protein
MSHALELVIHAESVMDIIYPASFCAMTKRRHLPVVGNSGPQPTSTEPNEPAEEERPAWHWSGIGTVMIFAVWLPLASLSTWISKLLIQQSVTPLPSSQAHPNVALNLALFALHAGAFGLASWAGGGVVGRFGAQAGPREATVSGLGAAAIAWLLTVTALPSGMIWKALWLLIPVSLLGMGGAYLGGKFGVSKRGTTLVTH